MNESDFEAELGAVQPARVRPQLAERVAAELAAQLHMANSKAMTIAPDRRVQSNTRAGLVKAADDDSSPHDDSSPRGWSWWQGLTWALGGAAAAIAIFVATESQRGQKSKIASDSVAPETATLAINEEPDESVSELISTEDEGLIFDTDNAQPQRQLRLTYLERHTWTNPQTGAVIEFEVPREDIVWMPVAMQ